MSDWNLFYTDEAKDDLENKLDSQISNRIKTKLNWLFKNFDDITPLSLGGDWSGFFKLRVGDYRAIYDVDWKNKNLLVIAVDHRSKIYKRLS